MRVLRRRRRRRRRRRSIDLQGSLGESRGVTQKKMVKFKLDSTSGFHTFTARFGTVCITTELTFLGPTQLTCATRELPSHETHDTTRPAMVASSRGDILLLFACILGQEAIAQLRNVAHSTRTVVPGSSRRRKTAPRPTSVASNRNEFQPETWC